MEKGLWISESQFVSLSSLQGEKHQSLLGELYTSSAVTGFDPVTYLGLLPDPDPVLQKTGDGVEILRSLTADDKVISSMQNRKLGTLKKKDYLFEPGKLEDKEPDQASREICARLVDDLKKIDLYYIFSQVLDAPYYGQTPVEPIWDPVNGQLHIKNLKPRPYEWFSYNENHEPVFSGDMLNTPVIPEKLVIARHFPDPKNPYGLRLLSRCLWPVAIKKGGIQFWTVLCERFGMPWVIGKVNNDKDRPGALAMLTSMVQNAVAVLSGDAEVDIHTLNGKGGDLHPALVRHCDTAIARVLQGQSLTNEGAPGGNYSESKTSKDALDDFQEADEHLVVTFMNDLAKIYTRVNSATALAPVFRYREPEDYTALAELDTKLNNVGVKFTKAHFTRKYRLSEDEFELEKEPGKGPDKKPHTGPASEFSSEAEEFTPEQAVLERFSSGLRNSALNDTRKAEKAILNAINRAGSYEDAMAEILELYPDLETAGLEDILERGLFNAVLFGIHAEQEAGDDD